MLAHVPGHILQVPLPHDARPGPSAPNAPLGLTLLPISQVSSQSVGYDAIRSLAQD